MKDIIINFQKELDDLKKINPNKRRSTFLKYCKKNINETNKLNIRESSKKICGVCSLYFKEIMPEFEEVMDIACDLELPEKVTNRPVKDWEKLKKIIKSKH